MHAHMLMCGAPMHGEDGYKRFVGYAPALRLQAFPNHVKILCCFPMRFLLDLLHDVSPAPCLQPLTTARSRVCSLCAKREHVFYAVESASVAPLVFVLHSRQQLS